MGTPHNLVLSEAASKRLHELVVKWNIKYADQLAKNAGKKPA